MQTIPRKYWWPALIVLACGALALYGWQRLLPAATDPAFLSGNGRIEATEIDVATKTPGRVQEVLVREGDLVHAGQILARMQVQTLEAQHAEAVARLHQAEAAVASARAQVDVRLGEHAAAEAGVVQREAELDAARRRLVRSETLAQEGAASEQELDDDRARVRSLAAAVVAARAQSQAVAAGVVAARTQSAGAGATVVASAASVARAQAELDDTVLLAPRDARVQYRIAEAGEVLGGGGKLLNLVDLTDVYMTFFVPEQVAGRLALGSEVRMVLDAAPEFVIPARISFVASTAQFTPKSVETANERQKLMFRVRAQIGRDLLVRNAAQVKTGLPGVAWIRLDASKPWPDALALKASP